jgi:hypothetical protein
MFGDYEERQRGQYCKDCGSVENLGSAEGGVRDLTISAPRPVLPNAEIAKEIAIRDPSPQTGRMHSVSDARLFVG